MDFINTVLHFFYPSSCLHCKGAVSKKHHLLCSFCFDLIEWIDGSKRCPICAGPSLCNFCKKKPKPIRPHLSLFEGCGPILSLYYDFLKTGHSPSLASLTLLALGRSSFPIPDIVVPHTSKFFPKKEPSYLLAKALGRLIDRPFALPSPQLQDKTLLLITPVLHKTDDLLEMKRVLRGHFPLKVYSLALIDYR